MSTNIRLSICVIPLILALIFAALCGLGLWQLNRAAQKTHWATVQGHQSAQLIHNADLLNLPPQAVLLTPTQLTGTWDFEHQLLWDNQTHQGRVGYHVLTPFQVTDGPWVLVDRGFIAGTADRRHLPSIPAVRATDTIKGQFFEPQVNAFIKTPLEDRFITWPLRLQKLDWSLISGVLDRSLYPLMFHIEPSAPEAFVKTLPQPFLTADKHRGYAAQWFMLAVAFLLLIVAYWRQQRKSS